MIITDFQPLEWIKADAYWFNQDQAMILIMHFKENVKPISAR